MATLGLLLLLELSALGNLDLVRRAVTAALGDILDLLDDLIALEDFTEDDVTAIQPPITCQYCDLLSITSSNVRSNSGSDEELRTVGVLAGVGHTQKALLSVPYLEVLVLELVTVDRLTAGACIISICSVSFSEYTRNSPSPRVKSPPWIMKSLITRWKEEPS